VLFSEQARLVKRNCTRCAGLLGFGKSHVHGVHNHYSGIMQGLEFAKVADARAGFKKMLDAASEGRAATVRREADVIAMVAADDLRRALAHWHRT